LGLLRGPSLTGPYPPSSALDEELLSELLDSSPGSSWVALVPALVEVLVEVLVLLRADLVAFCWLCRPTDQDSNVESKEFLAFLEC
jgi:hypothetical protein